MIDAATAPYAAFVLRLTLGVALLAHSVWLKLFVFTMPGTARFFESLGLPGALAYVTLVVEAVAGVMLVLGVKARIAALAALPILLGATWAHAGNGWMFADAGGGFEYPLFWSFVLVAQALLGDGAFALAPSKTLSAAAARRARPGTAGLDGVL